MSFLHKPTQYFQFPYTPVSNNNSCRRTCEVRAMLFATYFSLGIMSGKEFVKLKKKKLVLLYNVKSQHGRTANILLSFLFDELGYRSH